MQRVFGYAPRVPPGDSSLASHFASKILTFKTSLPQGSSDDLPRGGYGFFLELHNVWNVYMLTLMELGDVYRIPCI